MPFSGKRKELDSNQHQLFKTTIFSFKLSFPEEYVGGFPPETIREVMFRPYEIL